MRVSIDIRYPKHRYTHPYEYRALEYKQKKSFYAAVNGIEATIVLDISLDTLRLALYQSRQAVVNMVGWVAAILTDIDTPKKQTIIRA